MAQGANMPKPFCPSGYITSQEAIERCALQWFAEKFSELEAAATCEQAANGDQTNEQELTPIEVAARAFSRTQGISENLQQQFTEILISTEHRLRNLLYQVVPLSAYYFHGIFGQARHVIAREFWPTEEADGVLISGRYWPFGQPGRLFEERPSYPVFFSESELSSLLESPEACLGNEHTQTGQAGSAARQPKVGWAGAKARGIHEAVDDLWPNGIPKGFSAKERNNRIIKWLDAKGYSRPINPERAIQRVLQVRRSRGIR
jgi:hypothetical protein